MCVAHIVEGWQFSFTTVTVIKWPQFAVLSEYPFVQIDQWLMVGDINKYWRLFCSCLSNLVMIYQDLYQVNL